MSTRKGGLPRGPPKHQNKTSFADNPHSTKSTQIHSLPNAGLCQRCHDIIEWKKKYHKFKPLTAPKTCTNCHQRTVKHAYHVICVDCARMQNCCAKCCEPREIVNPITLPHEIREATDETEAALASMSLRQKKTYYRHLEAPKPGEAPPVLPKPKLGRFEEEDEDDEYDLDELDDGSTPQPSSTSAAPKKEKEESDSEDEDVDEEVSEKEDK